VALTKISAGVIAANAVVDSFGTQSITGDKIGLTAINANNIVNSSITGDKIGAGQITANLFAAGAVSATSISNGTSNVSILSSDGAVSIGTNGTEALRVDTSRNIGIGTATPTTRLDISAANAVLASSGIAQVGANTAGADVGGQITFRNSDARRAAIAGRQEGGDAIAGYLQFGTRGTSGDVTEQARITSTGDFQMNSGYGSVVTAYGCRAWVNFNGTGTVAIRASGNVSSITDNGTGTYTVNFTTAMPDANYCVNISAGQSSLGGAKPDIITQTTTNTQIITYGNGNEDMARVSVSLFR
jgi:hypothetical protein